MRKPKLRKPNDDSSEGSANRQKSRFLLLSRVRRIAKTSRTNKIEQTILLTMHSLSILLYDSMIRFLSFVVSILQTVLSMLCIFTCPMTQSESTQKVRIACIGTRHIIVVCIDWPSTQLDMKVIRCLQQTTYILRTIRVRNSFGYHLTPWLMYANLFIHVVWCKRLDGQRIRMEFV